MTALYMLTAAVGSRGGGPGAVLAQQPKEAATLDTPEQTALCSAIVLARSSAEVGDQLVAIATERLAETKKRADECAARPECSRSKAKEGLDRLVPEALDQLEKASELTRTLSAQRKAMRDRLLQLGGQKALSKCEET